MNTLFVSCNAREKAVRNRKDMFRAPMELSGVMGQTDTI